MFGREKNPVTPIQDEVVVDKPTDNAGKGRPTPKRKDAEAANKRVLGQAPVRPGASKQEARAAQRAERDKQYRAMQSGDERALPARDKGPERRYTRDFVDARLNVAEFFLPVAAVLLVVQMSFARSNTTVAGLATIVLYLYVIVAIVDTAVLRFQLKRRLTKKFGSEPKGTAMYAVLRASQLRPSRLPRPQVKRRAYPS